MVGHVCLLGVYVVAILLVGWCGGSVLGCKVKERRDFIWSLGGRWRVGQVLTPVAHVPIQNASLTSGFSSVGSVLEWG